jgi:hypothetical protein
LDIKRVAFETRPVKSKRPAVSTTTVSAPAQPASAPSYAPAPAPRKSEVVGSGAGKINREEIAAIVDRFLAGRPEGATSGGNESRQQSANEPEAEAGSMYAGPSRSARQSENAGQSGNGGQRTSAPSASSASGGTSNSSSNGSKTVDFVSEDDVKRAIQKGEKIFINAKTIITPAARDIGEPAEVFAKG